MLRARPCCSLSSPLSPTGQRRPPSPKQSATSGGRLRPEPVEPMTRFRNSSSTFRRDPRLVGTLDGAA